MPVRYVQRHRVAAHLHHLRLRLSFFTARRHAAAPRPEDVFAAAILQGSAARGDGVVHLTTTRSYEVTARCRAAAAGGRGVGRGERRLRALRRPRALGGAGFSVSLAPLDHTVVLADEHGLADGIAVAFLPLEPSRGDVRPQGGRQRQPRRAVAGGLRPLQLRQLRRARRPPPRLRPLRVARGSPLLLRDPPRAAGAAHLEVVDRRAMGQGGVSVVDERLTVVHNGHTYVGASPPRLGALAAAPLTPAHPEIYRGRGGGAPVRCTRSAHHPRH